MRFFFYGTLIAGSSNAVAVAAHGRLRDLGPATVPGVLYAIPDPRGWYPALLAGGGKIHGRLYETENGFGADDLAALDHWEDCDPARPKTSLYCREVWPVAEGLAQVYRFNQPLPEAARPITDGDFGAWLARVGLQPFA